MSALPAFPKDWEPTRATLHAYAHAVGAIPRAHAVAHPKWWHISLKPRPDGLVTDAIPLPDGGSALLRMDLRHHVVVLETSGGTHREFPLDAGTTATAFGDALIAAVAELGLEGEYAREKFENDEPRVYDPAAARTFFDIVTLTTTVFTRHRHGLSGQVGPIQLWPHGFDLAFEWFGTRVETYEEDGETTEYPSQINLGLYPAGRPYFYSNPWPFEKEHLVGKELPAPAAWNTDGWEGSILHYDDIQDDPQATERILAYARRVFELASPTLTV